MNDWSAYFLTWVVLYGSPVIGIVFLLGGIGLPVPASILVIAVGAFSQQGILDPVVSALVGFIAVVSGDAISYWIGRKAIHWFCPRFISQGNLDTAGRQFSRFGGGLIISTRSILSTLALPTNLTAGSSGYPFIRFLAYDAVGELIWIIGYGSLGYLFGSAWEDISDFLVNTAGFLGMMIIAGLAAYILLRSFHVKIELFKK